MGSKLLTIQEKYYKLVEDYLGDYYNYMIKHNLTFHETISKFFIKTNCPATEEEIQSILTTFEENVNKLWKGSYDTIINQAKNLNGIKTHYFYVPQSFENYSDKKNDNFNIFNRFGLYSDTIFIDDPMWRATTEVMDYEWPYRFSRFLISGFNILHMKELIFANVEQPILLSIPSNLGKEKDKDKIYNIIDQQTIEFTSSLFQKDFTSQDEIINFFKKNINSLNDFMELTKNNYYNYKFFIDGFSDMVKLKTHEKIPIYYPLGKDIPFAMDYNEVMGEIFLKLTRGLLSIKTQMQYKSMLVDAYPIYDEKETYNFANSIQKKEYLKFEKYLKEKSPKHMIGINTLTDSKFKWLGNVPIKTLIDMRENGEMNDFRSIISNNLNEYHNANLENIDIITKDVNYNITGAFKKYENELKRLNEKYKFSKFDRVGLTITMGLGITGFIFPPLALISVIVGGSTATDVIKKWNEKKDEIKELKKKPISILYEAQSKSNN